MREMKAKNGRHEGVGGQSGATYRMLGPHLLGHRLLQALPQVKVRQPEQRQVFRQNSTASW